MSFQVAIAGCGAVAQLLYRRPLRQLERRGLIRVATLVDPVTKHADALGASFPHATRHADLSAALSSTTIDVTLVLTPAHLHCEQAIAALRHGSHVLCEKPMASTAADCARMNAVAADTGRLLAVGMIRRFFPAFGQLGRMVADGALGAIRSFEYREGHKFEWDVTTPAAFRPRRDGGTGVLFDIGPHVVDALAWILGDLQVLAYADDALAGIESNASMALRSARCSGTVDVSWDYPQANQLRVVGELADAVLRVDRFDQLAVGRPGSYQPVAITMDFPGDLSASPARLSPRSYADAVSCQVVQFLRAVQLHEPPAADGESGQRCIAVLEAALAIAEPLPMPWLSRPEHEAFQRLHWRA